MSVHNEEKSLNDSPIIITSLAAVPIGCNDTVPRDVENCEISFLDCPSWVQLAIIRTDDLKSYSVIMTLACFLSHCVTQSDINCVIIFLSGTREMAFVHAISSAGVAHALTRACSSGELENCGCDRSLRGTSPEGFEV